jgi:hypothetical protein
MTDGEPVLHGMLYADKTVRVLGTRRQLRAAGLQPSCAAQESALVVEGKFVKARGFRFDKS